MSEHPLKKRVQKVVDDEQHRKDWIEYVKLPDYVKKQLDGDYIPGLDDGEGPREKGE